MHLESLEHRRLLSVSVENGVVTVTGDDNRNVVSIHKTTTELVVRELSFVTQPAPTPAPASSVIPRPRRAPRPTPPRPVFTATRVPLGDVTSLKVDVKGGSDRVYVARNITLPATIDGGAGNDHLLAGGGNDTVNCGDGNDFASGGGGNDTVNGDAGNDILSGDLGDDTVNGGDGRDRISGGLGADVLNGDGGNDYINALDRAGTDKVDGGANDPAPAAVLPRESPGDVCIADVGDAVSNCEVERRFPLPPPPPPPVPVPFPNRIADIFTSPRTR